MNRSECKRVFILGAGCSAQYGYPLGVKLVDELSNFLAKVGEIPSGCPIIQSAVRNSVDLAASFSEADTLDKLVNLSEERFKNFTVGTCVWKNSGMEQEEKLTYDEILNAKLAIAALFLDKEREARKKTLKGYKECLLPSIFERCFDWQSAVKKSDCSVLTFNYDRLFEMAFLEYFQGCFDPQRFSFYGKSVLNSGFDPVRDWGLKTIEIEAGCFCFLKLHGSAGWWAKKCESPRDKKWRDHWPESPQVQTDLFQLEQFLERNRQLPYKWEPLIAFPHEKQRFTSGNPLDFVQGPYIERIWNQAAKLLSTATEVTIIGYPFP